MSSAPVFVDPFAITEFISPGYSDITGRTEVSAALVPGEKTGVFIVPGQSLAANFGVTPYTPTSTKVQNLNLYDGKVYQMKDPALGADNIHGGYVGRLGQKLIDGGTFHRVIFETIAVGASTMKEWSPQGQLNHRLLAAVLRCRQHGYPISGIMLDLGNTDGANGTTQAAWQVSFQETRASVVGLGVDPVWWVANETMFTTVVHPTIQAAIAGVIDGVNVRAGADTDSLTDPSYRQAADPPHLTDVGNDSNATLWNARFAPYY